MGWHAELHSDRRGALRIRVVKAGECDALHVAQNANVMDPQPSRAGYSDADAQNPIPRSLSSMNVRNAITSGSCCSSARARVSA